MPDSTVVAVKKLESINFRRAENHKQFLAEVRTLGTIQHLNLVGLRGFSSDNNTMMLVYDYMPNGSVASHLFKGNDDSNILDWKMRYSIALGTARGLAYIHEKCRECIIHCDIKPDNVLLDSEFRPKVADFGMAKLFGRDFSRVLTTLRGTIGYLAPEWISGEAITAKADVYSYGMVLLELVSGMRNSQRHVCVGHYFPVWVANVLNEGGNVADLLDPRLQGNADGNDDSNILDWKTRYSIALGTARGLAYLHENCRECIIHYDIKPENVFLDSEFRPKVADFGMEKLFGRDFNRVLTTLKGTIGYLAPEWISGEAITAKADVYSYGMVLFELVSGMRNSQRHVCVGHYFPLWVANVINEGGNVAELLDPKLQGNADVEELERVCRVALWCIQNDQSHRPTMSHVVYFLEQVLEVNIPPVPRILKVFVDPDPEN
ncbi:G-type lectin S-receptor-like serine/threonine-protein kinase At2g19130 [Linum perenne]